MNSTLLHAWYSAQAAEKHGTAIYARPSGETVEVTCVSSKYDTDYRWPDKEYLGLVAPDCIRSRKIPNRG